MEINEADWLFTLEDMLEEAIEEGLDALAEEGKRVIYEETQREWKAKWLVEVLDDEPLGRNIQWGRTGDLDKPIPYFLNFGVENQHARFFYYQSKSQPGSLGSRPGGGIGKVIEKEPRPEAYIVARDFDISLSEYLALNAEKFFNKTGA